MSDGLVTRLGKWIDEKWASKVTEAQLNSLRAMFDARLANLENAVEHMGVEDLKTRMEKIELYSGMTRKVDPTKAPVAKSAFSM